MDNSNGQLVTKYQKLATEYSKIRSQVSVLKKAVLDEQATNVELRDQLKDRQVELRKSEQELDSLTFRNQQLIKRVTVLQEDLDRLQNKSNKKAKNKSENKPHLPSALPNNILDEEFQKKIVENAQLLSQLSDRSSEIDSLNERIQKLESKLDISEKNRVELESKYRETVDKLERERTELIKQQETVSWSSSSLDPLGNGSSKSESLSKVQGEVGVPKSRDESCDDFEFTKYCDIENEMNYWKTQFHIYKLKYDEMKQKESTETKILELNNLEPVETHNLLGKMTSPFAMPEEIEAREAKMKDYFLQEIYRLVREKHLYHVKNIAIAQENEVINAHFQAAEENKAKSEAALSEALSSVHTIQDDKDLQEGNYKSQLGSMSELLAGMNEKLIQQTEEIQRLKFELSTKNDRRGK